MRAFSSREPVSTSLENAPAEAAQEADAARREEYTTHRIAHQR
jgi:hypothetical protein